MKLLSLCLLLASSAFAQDGLTITGGHPRIYWDSTRLAAAQADYAIHPWTPTTISITNAGSWAAHSIITNTPSECTSAISTVVNFTISLTGFAIAAGAATTSHDNMRWNGEGVAEVYDWCFPQLSTSDAQLLRDRWAGTTSSPTDPAHVPTDLARASLTGIVTSTQSPFLANMANNNLLVYDSTVTGTNCPNERYAILAVIDANTAYIGGYDTSSSTVTVATGPVSFSSFRMGRSFTPGSTVRVSSSADRTVYMEGTVTTFTSGTLTLNVTSTGGSGTASSWEANPSTFSSSGCKARVSGYVDVSRVNVWGGPTMPYSNYFSGFWRNDILFGVAFSGESAYSTDFLDDAFGARWTNFLAYTQGLTPYTAVSGLGGLLSEGSEYGAENFYYRLMPWVVCKRYGRDLTLETNWFREAGVFALYNTTLTPTSNQNGVSYRQMFPWDDDQNENGYPSAMTPTSTTGYSSGNAYIYGYSDQMINLAQIYGSVNLGKYFRQYVQNVGAVQVPWFKAADPGGSVLSLSGLPLDYYTAGNGTLFTKNTWATNGTQARVMTAIDLSGHQHVDSGDWAIQRNGVWLAKEFTAYAGSGADSNLVCSYSSAGSTTPATTCEGRYGYAHNTITLGPATPTGCNTAMTWAHVDGQSSVVRLESRTNYSYIVADNSINYRASDDEFPCRDHNPYAGTVQREYLFIKPLETMVIFDRVQSVNNYLAVNLHPVITPATTVKTVLIHSPVAPTISSNTATWDNQGQRMKGWFFGPATIDLANVDEGNFTGHKVATNWYQQRLEFSNTTDVANSVAGAQSYFVSVLRTSDTSGWQDFTTATLVDNGSTFTLTLNHPTAGNAVWTIVKGSTSTGGTFGYATSGTPSQADLTTSILTPTVSDSGIVWATAPRIPGLFPLPNSLFR